MHRESVLKDMYFMCAASLYEDHEIKDDTFTVNIKENTPHVVELLKEHQIYFIEYITLAIRQHAEISRLRHTKEDFDKILAKTGSTEEAEKILAKQVESGDGGAYKDHDVNFIWADDALPKIDLDNLLAHDIGRPVCFDATILGLDEHQGVPYKYRVGYTDEGQQMFGKSATSEDLILEYQYDKDYHIIIDEIMTDLRYSVMEQDDGVYTRKEKRRVNGKLYTRRLVNMFERADKARIVGVLQKTKGKKRGKEKNEFDLYVRVIDASRRKTTEDAILTSDELATFEADAKDPDLFLKHITQSLAPHIYGMTLTKAAGLMAICGGYGFGKKGRDQLMVYIVGNPGVGKSQIGRALAEIKPSRSFYANFQQATARGMTFGQEEFDGRKILRAGVCVLFNYVILNEFDKGWRNMRDDISDIMSDELATYNRVPFNVSQHVDCTIIALGNPKARVWKHDLSLFKNLMPIEAQMLDRLWIIRATEEDAKERRKHAAACRSGIYKPPYTARQLAGWIAHRSTAEPPDDGAEEVLEQFFERFDPLRSDGDIELKFDARQETDVIRNTRALARLLGFDKVTMKCAHIAIKLYADSLRSLQINVDEGDFNKSSKLITDSDSMIVCFDTIVSQTKDADGYFQREAVVVIMAESFKNHWKTEQDADRYFEKLSNPPNQYIMSDRYGWCLVR